MTNLEYNEILKAFNITEPIATTISENPLRKNEDIYIYDGLAIFYDGQNRVKVKGKISLQLAKIIFETVKTQNCSIRLGREQEENFISEKTGCFDELAIDQQYLDREKEILDQEESLGLSVNQVNFLKHQAYQEMTKRTDSTKFLTEISVSTKEELVLLLNIIINRKTQKTKNVIPIINLNCLEKVIKEKEKQELPSADNQEMKKILTQFDQSAFPLSKEDDLSKIRKLLKTADMTFEAPDSKNIQKLSKKIHFHLMSKETGSNIGFVQDQNFSSYYININENNTALYDIMHYIKSSGKPEEKIEETITIHSWRD